MDFEVEFDSDASDETRVSEALPLKRGVKRGTKRGKYKRFKDEKRRVYAAMVYAVDRGVGRLVDALKANDVYDNTLIVFLSDNGGKIGAGSNNAPLKMVL